MKPPKRQHGPQAEALHDIRQHVADLDRLLDWFEKSASPRALPVRHEWHNAKSCAHGAKAALEAILGLASAWGYKD